jgi:hypothetical protein
MSKGNEQAEALKRATMEAGLLDQKSPPIFPLADEEASRPDQSWVQLPVDGNVGSDFNKQLGEICQGKGIYRYKGRLATVTIDPLTNRAEIKEMTPHRFRTWVEINCGVLCFRWQFSKNNGATKNKQTMGVEHSQTCLASDEFGDLQPRLLRVNSVRLPMLRKNGNIELLPIGYDAESGILTLPQSWEYDEEMTAEEGFSIWQALINEMPFQDERSRAVFYAALFSQFGYFLQPLDAKRINFLFHANSSRSGKTLLVEIILTVAWGYATIDSMPEDNGKLRDRLDTAVREAMPYLVLDDLEQTFLKSGLLNAFMTATWWGGRKFHSQEQFQEPKTPVVYMTANNLSVTPDIAGRTLICDLFTEQADAQSRNIERPLDSDRIRTPAMHRQLCSALWAMLKAWRDGKPGKAGGGRVEGKRMVRGYEGWSRVFGGIVTELGLEEPCQARKVEGTGNEEYSDMIALAGMMAKDVEKAAEYEFIDVVAMCRELDCFPHILAHGHWVRVKDKGIDSGERKEFELNGTGNSRLGLLFAKYGGKSFTLEDGRRVVFDRHGKNRHKRYMIQVTAAPVVPAA